MPSKVGLTYHPAHCEIFSYLAMNTNSQRLQSICRLCFCSLATTIITAMVCLEYQWIMRNMEIWSLVLFTSYIVWKTVSVKGNKFGSFRSIVHNATLKIIDDFLAEMVITQSVISYRVDVSCNQYFQCGHLIWV